MLTVVCYPAMSDNIEVLIASVLFVVMIVVVAGKVIYPLVQRPGPILESCAKLANFFRKASNFTNNAIMIIVGTLMALVLIIALIGHFFFCR